MFKQLVRIAASNQLRGTSQVVQASVKQIFKKSLPCQNALFCRQMVAFSSSTGFQSKIPQDLGSIVPDYAVHEEEVRDIKKFALTHEEVLAKHPLEYVAPQGRQAQDYSSQIKKNEFLLFNLPRSITKEKLNEICSEKGVQVIRSALTKSLDGEKYAFAFVEVGSPSQVKTLKEKFRNFWLEDRKIKLKSSEELGYENFDNRTIIVRNLPGHFKNKNLVELFSSFGSLTGIELPTKNLAIEEEIKNKMDIFVAETKEKQLMDTRRAQAIVQDSIRENEEYMRNVLSNYLGKDEAERILLSYTPQVETEGQTTGVSQLSNILDGQRQYTVQAMITQLQSENAGVLKAKALLSSLQQTLNEGQTPSVEIKEQIELNKETLKNALRYVNNNREAIDEATLGKLNSSLNIQATGENVDPIQRLQQLSRSELAFAYDTLLQCLQQREQLIKKRIMEQIDHLGKEERILFEEKDWTREFEDMKEFADPFNQKMKAEEILAVSEQVQNVMDFKNMTPEQRLYHILTKTYNPFNEANFNDIQLRYATSPLLNDFRIPVEPAKPNYAPTLNRLLFSGYRYTEDNLDKIKEHIADLRDKFDLPFDELYHKEKKLVDAVIKATQALRNKEAQLPDPMGADRQFDPSQLKGEYFGEEYQAEHQFVKDQRKRKDRMLNSSIDNAGSTAFDFKVEDTNSKVQRMLDQGILSQKEFDRLKQMQVEAQEVNLGYAFVTYSHSDEAKLALILGQNLYIDGIEVDLALKQDTVDHKDFDQRYKINKMRNEAKLSEELKTLRESRQQLREFEQNMDKDLPSLKKLKEFRKMARETLDNSSRPKMGTLLERTQAEEEALNEKIRVLQKENPDVDYTQLFDSERAEIARKAQHKKAFASYKAFQFLKHGVELQSKSSKAKSTQAAEPKQPAPYRSNDPYDFPPLQEAVDRLMKTKEAFPRVLDSGDSLDQKPGRKFGYTDHDFMEAYFGKDFARSASLKIEDTNLFGFNESYKKKYPIDKFQEMPRIEAQRQLLRDRADIHALPEESKDLDFQQYLERVDDDRAEHESVKDTPHPTEKGRSLVKDSQQRLQNYLNRKEKITGYQAWNTAEVSTIKQKLRDEYFPKPKKEEAPADTKLEEKFEPFYEGDGKDAAPVESSSEPTPTTSDSKPERKPSPKHYQTRESGKRQQQSSQSSQGKQKHFVKPSQSASKPQIPKYEETPFDAGTQKVEIDYQTPVSDEVQELNREFLYDYKHRRRTQQEDLKEGVKTQRIENVARQSGIESEDLMEQLKDWANIAENNTYGGKYTEKSRYGTLKNELDVEGRRPQARSLEKFAGDADLSEREDEDIYAHYMEQMRKAKTEEAKEYGKLSRDEQLMQDKINELEKQLPEMPRFEGFFKSQSAGRHPFEEQSELPKEDPYRLAEEEAYDEELLQRELSGRLIGETLTARQFGVLYKAKVDEGSQMKFMKDTERRQFIDNRDMVRLLDEQRESARRRMVLQGQCGEEESFDKIQEEVKKAWNEAPKYLDDHKSLRDFREIKNLFWQIQNPQRLFEKEYHFDEGLGQSLKEHVEELKERFPGLQVQVRRDRDGYPIVKTQYKPQYKYNLEDIENFDAEKEQTLMKETLDDVLKTVMGREGLNSLDKQGLESKMMLMKRGAPQQQFDEKTKEAISNLWKERVNGRFTNDREGFTKAFFDIADNATMVEGSQASLFAEMATPESVFSKINEERELMTVELSEQLASRVKEHLFLKERKASDFVKPRRSETGLFGSQVNAQENAGKILEKTVEQMASKEQDQGFDKAAYAELKAEIKRRRDAKERLLQQGFPELKPYISI